MTYNWGAGGVCLFIYIQIFNYTIAENFTLVKEEVKETKFELPGCFW